MEELAGKIDCDASTLQTMVDDFNAAVDSGNAVVDTVVFGKLAAETIVAES
ncbi:hypothetical protein I3I95_02200 [bacterium]|nr:hypothetical protein [bacterium]